MARGGDDVALLLHQSLTIPDLTCDLCSSMMLEYSLRMVMMVCRWRRWCVVEATSPCCAASHWPGPARHSCELSHFHTRWTGQHDHARSTVDEAGRRQRGQQPRHHQAGRSQPSRAQLPVGVLGHWAPDGRPADQSLLGLGGRRRSATSDDRSPDGAAVRGRVVMAT